MRNLDERLAEISRRSEVILKERMQRRKHILTACVPLVLCITIFGAFLFPGTDILNRTPESSNEQFSGALGKDEVGGVFAGSVEVSGNGISRYYTAVEDVQGIMSLLNEIVAVPEINDGDEDGDLVVEDSSSTDQKVNYKNEGHKILVKRSDGSITEYLLVGSLLIDQTTGQEFYMNEDTYFDLKDALGIPLY